jgi:DNA-binding IclR family transcriptional regulator
VSSLEKMLSLLDVFTLAAPAWSTEDLIRYSGCSRSTCYRYIKVLQAAGFLAPVAGGAYVLGPRIIELDRHIRLRDPVYIAGGPPLRELAVSTGHSALLFILFSDTVMCVREELSVDAPSGLLSRGERRSLFSGAASKVILAHLLPHQLRNLYEKHRKTIAAAGLGSDWLAFREALRAIRKDGYCMTVGEYRAGALGIAAPLFNSDGNVLGSIGIATHATSVKRSDIPGLANWVMKAGRETTERICSGEHGVDLPARAVG